MYQNTHEEAKAALKQKYIVFNVHINNEEFKIKKLEKEKQMQTKQNEVNH